MPPPEDPGVGGTTSYSFPWHLGNVTYEMDYFAGSAVLVYAEDVLLDDIVRIGWSVQQNRTPIYGYASQYFNALAAGNVIGQGSFWVDFKEAAYIPLVLQRISSRRNPAEPTYSSPAGSEAMTLIESADIEPNVRRAGIERLLTAQARAEDDPHQEALMQDMLTSLGAMSDSEFEDIAETFEDALWHGGNGGRGRQQLNSGNYGGGELTDEQWLAFRRGDQYPPFDLFVTFGDINSSSANHSVIRMLDVTITGTSFDGIEATGEPITVRYDWLARNIV